MLIMAPLPHDWAGLETVVGSVDDDFVAVAQESPAPQSRPNFDFFDRGFCELILITRDMHAFRRVSGLRVENWESDDPTVAEGIAIRHLIRRRSTRSTR